MSRTARTASRHRRLVTVVAAVATVALTLAATVGRAAAGDAQQEISPRVTVTGAKLPASSNIGSPDDPAIGKAAPALSGKGFDGKNVTFASDSTPRFVLFVAHWCPHCQREVPLIVKLAKRGKLDGVQVQTVSTSADSDLPNWPPSAWLEDEHWPFTPVLADDAKGRALTAFGGNSFPFFVLVDAQGQVVARASGELSGKQITTAVKNLAAGKSVFG
jgi:cytochrome c biogenesis protein CcmG/thiol:disulfide interchange protein DsbE